ncbi:hypothetical protein PG990_014414 [Apiospora arundinis]
MNNRLYQSRESPKLRAKLREGSPASVMWFINADSMEQEEFSGQEIPAYAIIPCIWAGDLDEATAKADTIRRGYSTWKQGSRWDSVRNSREHTKERHVKYVWVDTSWPSMFTATESFDANNAMHRWYREADAWFIHLGHIPNPAAFDITEWLLQCWQFARGWTLEEFVVPPKVLFYDHNACIIGEKLPGLMPSGFSKIYCICQDILQDDSSTHEMLTTRGLPSITGKSPTRKEDSSYCGLYYGGTSMIVVDWDGQSTSRHSEGEITRTSIHTPSLEYALTSSSCKDIRFSLQSPSSSVLPASDDFASMSSFNWTYGPIPPIQGQLFDSTLLGVPDSDRVSNPIGKAEASVSARSCTDLIYSTRDTFVKMSPWKLLLDNSDIDTQPGEIYFMSKRIPSKLENCPITPSFGLQTFQISINSPPMLQEHEHIGVSKKASIWPRWMLQNLRQIGPDNTDTGPQDYKRYPIDPGHSYKSRGPDEDMISSVVTSYLESNGDIDIGGYQVLSPPLVRR